MGGEESDETIGHWLACSVPEIGELLRPPLGACSLGDNVIAPNGGRGERRVNRRLASLQRSGDRGAASSPPCGLQFRRQRDCA